MFSKSFFQSIDKRVAEYRERLSVYQATPPSWGSISVILVTDEIHYSLCGVLGAEDDAVVVLYYGAPSVETVDGLDWSDEEQDARSAIAIPYELIRSVHFTAIRPDDSERIGFRTNAPSPH